MRSRGGGQMGGGRMCLIQVRGWSGSGSGSGNGSELRMGKGRGVPVARWRSLRLDLVRASMVLLRRIALCLDDGGGRVVPL